ncbi:MAG: HipA domain-containing protein [Bacteroidia bacterium]|nr:HipA domain-containing protein [Bacteroidia bacterium]
MLRKEEVENYSGNSLNLHKYVPPLRKGFYKVLNISVSGDAPKNFISVYRFGKGVHKCNCRTWPKFIAKVGQKWYPIESVTEHLLNAIGEELGLTMAASELVMAGSQLRFLSKYFLSKDEILVHGAEIFDGYIYQKNELEQMEEDGLARKFFTFQFAENAIRSRFPEEADSIFAGFVKMLIFDSITGNNDRHFYNWGVIKHISNKKRPTFAPIYDSARGLFWNNTEEKIIAWSSDPKRLPEHIKKYAEGSKPKTGWEGLEELNHFQLIEKIFSTGGRYKGICKELINSNNKQKILNLVDDKFSNVYSKDRKELIKRCLDYRFERLIAIVTN